MERIDRINERNIAQNNGLGFSVQSHSLKKDPSEHKMISYSQKK